MNNQEAAEMLTAAIKTMASSENALCNFECYLSYNFDKWLEKWANTPEDMAAEMKQFAEMFSNKEAAA